jgi:hypothetical protein
VKPRLPKIGRRRLLMLGALAAVIFVLLAPFAGAADVYGNIGPAPAAGGIFTRYPLTNYQLDQYFPAISVGVFSGIDTSGLLPMIAYFIAQMIWLITAFISYLVITLFAFAYSLDLVNGNGAPGSGALAPVSQAVQNIYRGTFGQPWLIAAVSAVSLWAMWRAIVQRQYTQTAAQLAASLAYVVLSIGIVTQPQATIAPVSKYSNEVSTSLLSLSTQGKLTGESAAKQAASSQLFTLLVLQPWTVLEFGGTEHCTAPKGSKAVSVPVRPLASTTATEDALAGRLEHETELSAEGGKTCVNNQIKYAPHFLQFPFQSKERNAEHEALEHGSASDLPEADPAKHDGSYKLGPTDEPAAEAMGKGGQSQRLLLAPLILAGSLGVWLLLAAFGVGMLRAALLLLLNLALAPFVLVLAVFPGRGHALFRNWLSRLAGYLLRKVVYSAILAVLLAVSAALTDATSSLGWLMAFGLQALLMWSVFLQRDRIAGEFLTATAGPGTHQESSRLLANTYFAARLAQMTHRGGRHRAGGTPSVSSSRPHGESGPAPTMEPVGVDVPEPGEYTGAPISSTEGDTTHYQAAVTDLDEDEPAPDPTAARGVDVPEPEELMDMPAAEPPRGVDVPEPHELMDPPPTDGARPDVNTNDNATD